MKTNISNMPPLEIKVLLLKNNVTQAEIARSLNVTIQTVNQVLHGRFTSHPVRAAIAKATGTDLKILWPRTYLYGGPRKRGRPFSEESKKRAVG